MNFLISIINGKNIILWIYNKKIFFFLKRLGKKFSDVFINNGKYDKIILKNAT
jgi:hypothetical protein